MSYSGPCFPDPTGRVKDFCERKVLDLSKLCFRVLDEADEMLNMGFVEDVEYILSAGARNRSRDRWRLALCVCVSCFLRAGLERGAAWSVQSG